MKLGNETIKRQIQLIWDLEINLTADYYNHWGNNQREEAKGDNVIANYKERAATESKWGQKVRSAKHHLPPAEMMDTKYWSCYHTSVIDCGKLTWYTGGRLNFCLTQGTEVRGNVHESLTQDV